MGKWATLPGGHRTAASTLGQVPPPRHALATGTDRRGRLVCRRRVVPLRGRGRAAACRGNCGEPSLPAVCDACHGGGGVSSTGCDIKEKKKLILFSYAAGCLHLAHTTRLWQPRRTRRHPPSLAPDALAPPSPTAAHSSRPPRIPRRTRVCSRAGGREASPPRWPRVGRASAAASVHTSAALIPS